MNNFLSQLGQQFSGYFSAPIQGPVMPGGRALPKSLFDQDLQALGGLFGAGESDFDPDKLAALNAYASAAGGMGGAEGAQPMPLSGGLFPTGSIARGGQMAPSSAPVAATGTMFRNRPIRPARFS